MAVVLAADAAWGGLGWCLATEGGPLTAGHIVLKARARRVEALQGYLDALWLPLLEEQRKAGSEPRIVIEAMPEVYRRGNQANVGYGLGRITGSIEMWAVIRGFAEPELMGVREWRSYWSIVGPREAAKARAIRLVEGLRWGAFLRRPNGAPLNDDARGDVAEAILLGMAAARKEAGARRGRGKR